MGDFIFLKGKGGGVILPKHIIGPICVGPDGMTNIYLERDKWGPDGSIMYRITTDISIDEVWRVLNG